MTVGARALSWVLLAWLVASCSKASPGHSSSASSSTVPSGAVPVATALPPPSAPPPPPIVRSEGMPGSFAPLARRADPAVATVKARVERQQQPGGRRRTVAEGLGTAFVS